jgi:hypothetical protein
MGHALRRLLKRLAFRIASCGGLRRARPDALSSQAIGLKRGINLSHWFAQSYEGYSQARLDGFVTRDEIHRLALSGFDHVRLSVAPAVLFPPQAKLAFEPMAMGALHRALDHIQQAGLAAIVDLHPIRDEKNVFLAPDGADRLIDCCHILAKALAKRETPGLALEILNEPEPLAGDAWWRLQERALAAIRDAGFSDLVIANAGGWSGMDDLAAHEPYSDPRVVYTVHFYAPMLFTHQSASWSLEVARQVGDLGWPLDPADAERAAKLASRDVSASACVRGQIANGQFSLAAMKAQFDRLTKWQSLNGHPTIYVGEFGVYAPHAPAAARLAWIKAARDGFEQRNWGWALWDYSPDFGFLTDGTPPRAMDASMLAALGFRT